MSLLANIQKKRRDLAHCTTTVNQLNGEKYQEITDGTGNIQLTKLAEKTAGFIQDFQPDLKIAEILQFLTLGSQDVAADILTLKNNKITHVLSVGVKISNAFGNISYEFVELLDEPNSNLLEILPKTNGFIESVRNIPNGRVFVHCNAGCSRAPSVVIAYLMFSQKWTFDEAFQFVGDKRYVRPNSGFVQQLKQYEKL